MAVDEHREATVQLQARFDDGRSLQRSMKLAYSHGALPGELVLAVSVPGGSDDERALQQAEAALRNALDTALLGVVPTEDVDDALGSALGLHQGSLRSVERKPEDLEPLDIESVVGAEMYRRVQRCLSDLVDRTTREGKKNIVIGHLDVLGDYFEAWMLAKGQSDPGGVRYGGRKGEPGLWHLLQEVHPLDVRQKWNPVRLAIIQQRIADGRWKRLGKGPRTSEFLIRCVAN